MIVLTPALEQELVDALAEAFTPEDLEFKVAEPLKISVAERNSARDVRERARALVVWAKKNGVDRLVSAALGGNPTSPRLRRFAASIGLLASPEEILKAIGPSPTPRDQIKWTSEQGIVQRQVCGIKTSDNTQFTGFLVGDDQVMTIGAPKLLPSSGAVTFLFEGATLNIHPNAPIVVEADDVLVLRLERPIARETASEVSNVAVRTRGWVAPVHRTTPASEDDRVIIVQYVSNSLLFAVGVLSPSLNIDELRYKTETYPGSLGAPCFDASWHIIGINYARVDGVNIGRSINAITAALHAAGYGWDASRGIHPLATQASGASDASSHGAATGEHDAIVRGIAKSISTEDDVWSDDVDDLDLDKAECWAWVEAAAVHATFNPETIRPFGDASRNSLVALLLESRQVGVRWMLNDTLRRAALARLAARGALKDARGRNEGQATDPVDVMLGRLVAGSPLEADDQRNPDALRALLTATGWLEGLMTELPDAAQLRASLERATLLAPFHHLTQGFFAGRETELDTLTAYCQEPPQPPLFIHAPGGMGKSALLARFVLQMAQRDPSSAAEWRPFIYIDFDRPELDASNLAGVLAAIVRQLGPQVPVIADAAQTFLEAQRRPENRAKPRATRSKKNRGNIASQVASSQVDGLIDAMTPILLQLPGDGPIVMILDTLEEVQFSNPDAVGPLVNLMHQLQKRAPRLRPILAGRIVVDVGVTQMELSGLPIPACVSLLQNELPKDLASNVDLVSRLAQIVAVPDQYDVLRGNPLSLRLAAEVMRREAKRAAQVIKELDDDLRKLVGDAIVQGRLYERVLGHIHDKRVAALAHPGLALRVITAELIHEVLAVPCGLGVIDQPTADELFDKLAGEVALVTQGISGDQLVLRPELRRIVRDDLAKDSTLASQRQEIHAAAVQFYAPRPLPSDRAEEIYHRLALDQDPEAVDSRWITGLEQYLRDAVGELPPRANAYLANRVGGVADESQLTTASPLDWEEYAQKRATDLLKFGQPQKALDLLAQRSERLPASKLHYVESIAKRMLQAPDLDGAQSAAEAAVAAARASSNNDDLRDALEELVLVRRLRNDTAGVLRALAELADFGDMLGDDLVLLEANVQGLESMTPGPMDRSQFTQSAVRVFSRLPDQLIARAPELARRVAAQVGGVEPATLQRVIRVVGTGSLDEAAASALHDVLEEWKHADPQVGAFIPDASKPPLEIASAARYLATTLEMDAVTAGRFADWLGSVVNSNAL